MSHKLIASAGVVFFYAVMIAIWLAAVWLVFFPQLAVVPAPLRRRDPHFVK